MSTTTSIPTVSDETSHASLPDAPRVVRSPDDASLLSEDITEVQQVSGETMTVARQAIPIPRVIRSTEGGKERFTLLQKWDGVVLETDSETFTARLIDSYGELPPQQATFSRSELSPQEETQIAIGASFVWTIGYRHIGATRHRDSAFYFRRLPTWTDDELTTARFRAKDVSTAIGWK